MGRKESRKAVDTGFLGVYNEDNYGKRCDGEVFPRSDAGREGTRPLRDVPDPKENRRPGAARR